MLQEELTNKVAFSELKGRGVKVAVVDSGIDSTHPKIKLLAGGVDLSIGPDGQVVSTTDCADRAGHGTACAGIILRKAPEVALYSIRIFDESLGTDGRTLVAALRWAIEHEMDVVNLSLGTTDVAFRDDLTAVCRQAHEAGTILVAAEHNEGLESYPAVLPQVIGVTAGKVYGRYGYFFRAGETIECVARGDAQRLCWLEPREVMAGGTSFAAPHISGIVALIKEACPQASLGEVCEILQANATDGQPELVRGADYFTPPASRKAPPSPPTAFATAEGARPYDWIGKAALYPYNKEMHGFVRYLEGLAFEIVGIADPVGKGLVGKDAGEAIGLPPAGIRIAPRLVAALEGADTLILGYVDELARIAKRDVLRESIQTALDKGLHVFSFLPVPPTTYGDLYAKARDKKLKIAYPDIAVGEVQRLLQKPPNHGAVDVPVVGVFGTSSQQGKFTVQLALRKKLLEMGYKVGQIGTEHQSELFGMDLAFPMGYASPLVLPVQAYVPYLDIKMREICRRKQPDILLVGSQSGTIPYDIEEHGTHALPTIAFLLGTKPDVCILVVNSIDSDEYIQDTMNAIRALGKAPTILLAMSDKEKHIRAAYGRNWVTPRQLSREEINEKLRYLEDKFDLPAVEIASEEGQQRIMETVIQHFAAGGRQEKA